MEDIRRARMGVGDRRHRLSWPPRCTIPPVHHTSQYISMLTKTEARLAWLLQSSYESLITQA